MFPDTAIPAAQSSISVGYILLTLAAIAGAVMAFERWIRRAAGRPDNERTLGGQPIEIRPAARWVTREEMDRDREAILNRVAKVESDVTNIGTQLDRMRRELHETELRINGAGEDRASKIHERINDVLEAVSELRGQVTGPHSAH